MTVKVSVKDKKVFIRELFELYKMKRRESVWILNYVMSHDSILENIHFVDDITGFDNAVVMSTHNSDEKPFIFIKDGERHDDSEKAFHYIRLNYEQDFYVKIDAGPSLVKLDSFLNVLEENPHANIPKEFSIEAMKLLNKVEYDFQINMLKKKIDEAIDNEDKEAFMKYSGELNKIV